MVERARLITCPPCARYGIGREEGRVPAFSPNTHLTLTLLDLTSRPDIKEWLFSQLHRGARMIGLAQSADEPKKKVDPPLRCAHLK